MYELIRGRNRQLKSISIADRTCQRLTFTVALCGPYSCGNVSVQVKYNVKAPVCMPNSTQNLGMICLHFDAVNVYFSLCSL